MTSAIEKARTEKSAPQFAVWLRQQGKRLEDRVAAV